MSRNLLARLRALSPLAKGIGAAVTTAGTVAGILAALGVVPFDGSKNALAAAAVKTSDAGSSRVDLSKTIRADSRVDSSQAAGVFDYRAQIGRLNYTNGQKQIFLKPYVYEFGVSKQPVWCEYDLSGLGPGFLFGAITGFRNDPGAALINLKESGTYKKVGKESLFGVVTTHYAGNVELAKLEEREADPTVLNLMREFSAYNQGRLPVDVWVGPDEFVRRLGTAFALPVKSGRAHIEAIFDLSHYGIAVAVKRPPRSGIAAGGTKGCPNTP
jgi:hypothetical protein